MLLLVLLLGMMLLFWFSLDYDLHFVSEQCVHVMMCNTTRTILSSAPTVEQLLTR
jgi:hypothetical protein